MGRRVVAGILIVLAVVAGIGLFGWLMLRRSGANSIATLPNGVRIKVESVTFGTNHVFTTDSKLTRTLRRVLSASLQRLLPPAYTSKETTTEPQALIYLSAFDPATRSYGATRFDRFDIIDEHDCIWPIQQWSNPSAAPTFCVSTIYAAAFPRRRPDFRLRAYFAGGTTLELRVPNPVKGPFPKWTAEPLPARRTIGDLTFELREVRARWSTNVPNSFTPDYAVFRNGQDVTPEWRPVKYLRDETGNRAERLCPYEDVWKVELKFLKTAKASFSPSQIWRIPSIMVPDDGRARIFNQSHSLSNIQIQLIALTGRGDFRFSNGVLLANSPWSPGISGRGESSSSSSSGTTIIEFVTKEPSLLASITGLSSVEDLLIRYRDPTARTGEAAFRSSFGNQYRFAFPDLKRDFPIDLEVIRQEPITVEFTVRPPSPPAIVTKP